MSTYGRQVLESIGRSLQVTADGAPVAKAGGVTINWDAVTAFAADTVFENEDYVYAGEKFLRYGQIVVFQSSTGKYIPYASGSITKGLGYILNESVHENQPNSDHPPVIDGGRVYKSRLLIQSTGAGDFPAGESQTGVNDVQTITTGAGNTGGSFTVTWNGQTTAAVAYNASASALQAALEALSNIGLGNVTVTRTGDETAGFVYTITFTGDLADYDAAAFTTTPSLTGGANTAAVASVTTGTQGIARPTLAVFEAAFPNITYVPEPNYSFNG